MPSTTTQPIATRVPNLIADEIRHHAEKTGTTVSAVLAALVTRHLDALEEVTA